MATNSYETTVTIFGSNLTIRVTRGARIRTFGGWWQHDQIELKISETEWRKIGRIQTRRRHKRTEITTLNEGNACVLGSNIPWLVEQGFAPAPL